VRWCDAEEELTCTYAVKRDPHSTGTRSGHRRQSHTVQLTDWVTAICSVELTINAQLLSPPHTPHKSSVEPAGQHRPLASSDPLQHLPLASTTVALPLHTPHMSTAPELQHIPSLSSREYLPEQHSPRTFSTVVQHCPEESMTAPGARQSKIKHTRSHYVMQQMLVQRTSCKHTSLQGAHPC
jgi:hypothetical protein